MSKKPVLVLKIRAYAHGNRVSVWLLERNGAADSCLLFGEMLTARAGDLAAQLEPAGVLIERESAPYSFDDAPFHQDATTVRPAAQEKVAGEDEGEGKQLEMFG